MINLNTPNILPIKSIIFYKLAQIIPLSFLLFILFGKKLFFIPFFFIVFIVLPGCILIYLKLKFINFIVENDKITINSGILIKRSKSIPFNQVQNVDIVRGLLHRVFGLCRVNIWTSSVGQIQFHEKKTIRRPDCTLDINATDGEWLKNFILSKHS